MMEKSHASWSVALCAASAFAIATIAPTQAFAGTRAQHSATYSVAGNSRGDGIPHSQGRDVQEEHEHDNDNDNDNDHDHGRGNDHGHDHDHDHDHSGHGHNQSNGCG